MDYMCCYTVTQVHHAVPLNINDRIIIVVHNAESYDAAEYVAGCKLHSEFPRCDFALCNIHAARHTFVLNERTEEVSHGNANAPEG